MNKYLVVLLKSQWARENILPRIIRHAKNLIPFNPEVLHYFMIGDTVIFSAENPKAGAFAQKSHFYFHEDKGEALLIEGAPFFDKMCSRTPWADAIHDALTELNIEYVQEKLLGTYNITKIGREGITSFTDFTGTYPLFYMDNNHVTAISNRQLLLAKICQEGHGVNYNYNAMSWLPGQACVLGKASIFQDVWHLKPSKFLHVKKSLTVNEFSSHFWDAPRRELLSSDYDEITDILLSQSKALSNLPIVQGGISLTGGKDSRLVLALALKSGLINKVKSTFTNGKEGSPEIEIAKYISEAVGVAHKSNISHPWSITSESIWKKLEHHAFRFEGSICSWDGGGGSPARSTQLELNGMVGALYSRNLKRDLKGELAGVEDAYAMFNNYLQQTDPLGVMAEEFYNYQHHAIRSTVNEMLERGVAINDITDVMHAENRLPWWAGLMASNTFGRTRLFPLANFSALRKAYQAGHVQRQMGRFHFEILRRLRPDLAKMPFLNDRWDERLETYGSKDFTTKPFKTKAAVSSQNLFPWQWQFIESDWEVIGEFLTAYPQSGLFDIVDRTSLEKILSDRKFIRRTIDLKELLSLITLQITLTGKSLGIKEGPLVAPEVRTNIALLQGQQVSLNASRGLKKIYFKLPVGPVLGLRIDPIDKESEFSVGKIWLTVDGARLEFTDNGRDGLLPNRNVNTSAEFSSYTVYNSSSQDPFFHLKGIEKLNNGNISLVEIELASSTSGYACVYIDAGNGYSESHKVKVSIQRSSFDVRSN